MEKLGSQNWIPTPLMAGLGLSGGRGGTETGPGIFAMVSAQGQQH